MAWEKRPEQDRDMVSRFKNPHDTCRMCDRPSSTEGTQRRVRSAQSPVASQSGKRFPGAEASGTMPPGL